MIKHKCVSFGCGCDLDKVNATEQQIQERYERSGNYCGACNTKAFYNGQRAIRNTQVNDHVEALIQAFLKNKETTVHHEIDLQSSEVVE